jgi:phosphoglycerol transferase MdoB-like AlkP superfamily enzyme
VKYLLHLIFVFLAVAVIPIASAIPLQWISPLFSSEFLFAAALSIGIEILVVLFLLHNKKLNNIPLALVLIVVNIISVVSFIILPSAIYYPLPDNFLYKSGMMAVLFEAFVLTWGTHHAFLRKPDGEPLRFIPAFIHVLIANIIFIVCVVNFMALLLQF